MHRFLLLLVAAALLVASVPASAQTPPMIPADTPFRTAADHDGANTDGYRLFACPGTVTDCATQLGAEYSRDALAGGVVSVQSAGGLARGLHTLQLAAFNADHVLKSLPLVVRAVLPPPSAPGGLRILAASQAADGTLRLHFLEPEQLLGLLEFELPSLPPPDEQ